MIFSLAALCFTFCSIAYAEDSLSCVEGSSCEVGVRTEVYFDKSRERPFIVEIFYPPGRGTPSGDPRSINFKNLKERRNAPIPHLMERAPLILFSHGYMGDRYNSAWLLEFLAANGYIVAALDHFGSTHYMQRAEDSLKRWERPGDITFLIDRLLEDPILKDEIDPHRIGFIGYSDGGLTGIWLAGGIATAYPVPDLQNSSSLELDDGITEKVVKGIDFSKAKRSYEDKRIAAGVLLAPSFGFAFEAGGLKPIAIPLLIIGARGDTITPLKENGEHLAAHIKSAELRVLDSEKAGHYVFLNSREERGRKALPPLYTSDDPSVDRIALQNEMARWTLKFFDDNLKNRRGEGR